MFKCTQVYCSAFSCDKFSCMYSLWLSAQEFNSNNHQTVHMCQKQGPTYQSHPCKGSIYVWLFQMCDSCYCHREIPFSLNSIPFPYLSLCRINVTYKYDCCYSHISTVCKSRKIISSSTFQQTIFVFLPPDNVWIIGSTCFQKAEVCSALHNVVVFIFSINTIQHCISLVFNGMKAICRVAEIFLDLKLY